MRGNCERGAVAELGKAHHGEVVDGDDPGGATTRGDDEVGPVDDVGAPHEPLDGRTAEMRPRQVQRAGGHGPLADMDAGRHDGGQPLAAGAR